MSAVVAGRLLRPQQVAFPTLQPLPPLLHAVYWYGGGQNLYLAVATLPITVTLAVVVGVVLLARAHVAAGLLFLAQAVVSALPYLVTLGGSLRFAESPVAYDNVLSLTSWLICASLLASWISPSHHNEPGLPSNL